MLSCVKLCHHYKIAARARHIPGYLNVMADLLSRSNQAHSTPWSLHQQVLKQICQRWFIPYVDLFATHLNYQVPLYIYPVPEQNALDINALNINWSGLTAYAYSPTALLLRVIQKSGKQLPHSNNPRLARNALVLGPNAALNTDPTPVTSVNNTSETVPQPSISQQSTSNISTYTPGVLEWTAPKKASLWKWQTELQPLKVINKDHLQVKVGPI